MFFISEASKAFVELPPELCSIIMSPIQDSIIYSFSFIPSIMHRIESLVGAFNLKKMHLFHCTQNETEIMKVCTCSLLQSRKQISLLQVFFVLYIYISSCVKWSTLASIG